MSKVERILFGVSNLFRSGFIGIRQICFLVVGVFLVG